ncbi:contactin-associated protein-like 2 [Ylistrum balloti]|uniref:contactin-associated protein-like 2 n=1 Tax=Ylistrum balloti TaxID=509963 RepID=UPI002905E267|nr:contactin-associated protein-like 2 [Ylistrum balloti]
MGRIFSSFSIGCDFCDFDLVTGPYGVTDDALMASSAHIDCPLLNVRFSSARGWCPEHFGNGHYVQVHFKTLSAVKAIQTLGHGEYSQWVTSYKVNISLDGITWDSILNSTTGQVKVFPANFDNDTVVTNTLETNVVANYIRVISLSQRKHTSMRLEAKGCPVSILRQIDTCRRWEKKLGSSGDIFPVLLDTDATNHVDCGLKCFGQMDCDSFLFDASSTRCRLLKVTTEYSNTSVDLDGVWYFRKMH